MSELSLKLINKKQTLLALVIVALIASLIGGQVIRAAEASNESASANSSASMQSNSTIDVNKLSDGHYYVDYRVLYADQEKTSISSQYLVNPALLIVQGEQKSISLTVLQSKEIVGFTINGQEGVVSEEDSNNNSRVVTFQLDDITNTYPAWISIHWIVESIDFKYVHSYDIRIQFLPETIVKVAEDAPVPTRSGTVGFPSGLNESDIDNSTDDDNQETSEQETSEGSTLAEEVNTSFSDIQKHWARAAITSAIEQGIATGHSDGTFRPDAYVDRFQFAVMLSRALRLSVAGGEAKVTFADQQSIPSWAADHVNAVVNAKLMSGYRDNTFRGNRNISRAEIAVIISRAAKLKLDGEATLRFADSSSIPSWAQKEVAAAVQAGLVSGKGNNSFEPSASTTRAEAIAIIMRLLKYSN